MIIDFALPISGDIAKGFKRYQEVSKRAVMDYGFHMAITDWNDKVALSSSPPCFCRRMLTLLQAAFAAQAWLPQHDQSQLGRWSLLYCSSHCEPLLWHRPSSSMTSHR